jgi:hypothetical protein
VTPIPDLENQNLFCIVVIFRPRDTWSEVP